MAEPLICPKCKESPLRWITDMDADDLLEKGIMECKNDKCKVRFVGINGWQKGWEKEKNNE